MTAPAITHTTAADGTFSAAGAAAWDATHTLANLSGADKLLGAGEGSSVVDEITLGSGLAMTGTTLSATNNTSEVVGAGAPNQSFDLTNGGGGGAVTIISKSIAGIATGDQLAIEVWYTILNNSGSNALYTTVFSLGGLNMTCADAGNTTASATARASRVSGGMFSISASNLAYAQQSGVGVLTPTAADAGGSLTVAASRQGWNTSTSDLTGTQTIVFSVASSTVTTTQTLILHSYIKRKVSAV
mgnify:CR=1 FL=1